MHGSDAVADAFYAEEFDGFANCFWSTDFAGMNEPVQAQRCGLVIYRPQLFGGNAQLVAPDTEGND
jgi:hypothetical protein